MSDRYHVDVRPFLTGTSSFAAWVAASTVAGLALAVRGERPLVDAAVVAGLSLVVPLALGGPRRWGFAGVVAAVALTADSVAVATVLAVPAVVVSGWATAERLEEVGVRDVRSAMVSLRSLATVSYLLVPVWALVGAASVVASAARLELFGIGEPIVRLTAVHYLYAGVGALTIAHRSLSRPSRGRKLSVVAVAATASAPPIVAAGFVLGHPIPQIGGAVLMTVGVWATAALLLVTPPDEPVSAGIRALRGLAGVTPWVPMVLAVGWAAAQHLPGVPALSVTDMARTHGAANGVGFVILGLISTRTVPVRSATSTPREMAA